MFKDNLISLRKMNSLSQEELAEKIGVSRQTLSKYETGESVPDIEKSKALADVFGVSLDELIKGDVDTMKETITKNDGRKLKKLEYLALVELLVLMFGVTLLVDWGGEIGRLIGIFLAGALTAAIFMTFHKMEQIKKDNDVQTYREVIAFMKGESLDDIEKAKELEKRGAEKKKIQIFLLCYVLSGAILALICHYLL